MKDFNYKSKCSCNTICSSERATLRKCRGAFITSINDDEVMTLEQARKQLADLWDKKVTSFTMVLAREPKPSKMLVRRAYDELELPGFDIDENLGEDYFSSGEHEGSEAWKLKATEYVPSIGTRILKEFKGGDHYEGRIVSGPHEATAGGHDVQVWKVLHTDGDKEDLTAAEVEFWKAAVQEVESPVKKKAKRTRLAMKIASRPSGDRAEDIEPALPEPKEASAPTHKRRSTRLQQQASETARIRFIESNP